MSVYKNIIGKASTYSVATLFGRLFSFLLVPVYTRFLHPADYGVLELLDITLFVFGSLVGVLLGESLFYFYSASKTEEGRNTVTSTAMLGSMLLGVVGISFLLGKPLAGPLSNFVFGTPKYTTLFFLAFINLGLGVPVETGMSWLRVNNRARHFAVISIGRYMAAGILNVVFLVVYHMGVASIQWSALLTSALTLIYLCVHVLSRTGVRFAFSEFSQQIRYAAPLTVSGMLMLILHYGDRIFLQRTVSLAEIGIYSMAYKVAMLVSVAHTPFKMYWGSQMFSVVREENGARVYVRIATYLCFTLSLVAVLIGLFIHPIMRIMAAPDFRGAAAYVPLLALAYLIRAAGDHARSVFAIEKKTTKYLTCNLVGSAACLVLYATLIPRYGVWGAVISTLGGFAVLTGMSFWEAQRVRYYDLEYGRYFHVVLCSVGVVAFGLWLNPQGFSFQVAVGFVLFVAWWVILIVTGFFDEAERKLAIETLTGLRRRALYQHD